MTKTVRDVMTPDPTVLPASTSVLDAARMMRERDVGDVLVTRDRDLIGILTDRDIVVRAVAEGREPQSVDIGEICSEDLAAIGPDDNASEAVATMRRRAVRRVPVVDDGRAVGILSLGDLALELDAESALADISAAPANT